MTAFDIGLSDGVTKIAISDELAQRVADERLWRSLSGGDYARRRLHGNQGLNVARDLRRQVYTPVHGPWQQQPRKPRPGESSAEGAAKRERRWLRNVVAKKNNIDPRAVITDEVGKKVLYKATNAEPAEVVSAARKAARGSANPVSSVIPGKPMSTKAKAGLGAAALLAAYGVYRATTPKRYDDGIAKVGSRAEAAREFAGLALIAAPVAHGLVQRARGKKLTHRQEQVHAVSDLAGLGLLAAPYAKKLLTKKAAASSPDTTGAGATTSGELERDVSAPGVSGKSWAQLDMDARVEPGPSPRRGRGVPEWVRHLKRMAYADEAK